MVLCKTRPPILQWPWSNVNVVRLSGCVTDLSLTIFADALCHLLDDDFASKDQCSMVKTSQIFNTLQNEADKQLLYIEMMQSGCDPVQAMEARKKLRPGVSGAYYRF